MTNKIELLTTKQAARVLNSSPAAVRMQVLRLKLRAQKIGRDLFIKPEDLAVYINKYDKQYDYDIARLLDVRVRVAR